MASGETAVTEQNESFDGPFQLDAIELVVGVIQKLIALDLEL